MNSSLTLHWACFSTPAPLNRFSPHQLTQRMAFNHHWRPAWIFIDPGVACETICRVRVLMKISELLSLWTAPRVGLLISNQSFWVCFCDKASYSDWNFSTGATVISISFNIYLNVIPAISNQYTSSAAQTDYILHPLAPWSCQWIIPVIFLTFFPYFYSCLSLDFDCVVLNLRWIPAKDKRSKFALWNASHNFRASKEKDRHSLAESEMSAWRQPITPAFTPHPPPYTSQQKWYFMINFVTTEVTW